MLSCIVWQQYSQEVHEEAFTISSRPSTESGSLPGRIACWKPDAPTYHRGLFCQHFELLRRSYLMFEHLTAHQKNEFWIVARATKWHGSMEDGLNSFNFAAKCYGDSDHHARSSGSSAFRPIFNRQQRTTPQTSIFVCCRVSLRNTWKKFPNLLSSYNEIQRDTRTVCRLKAVWNPTTLRVILPHPWRQKDPFFGTKPVFHVTRHSIPSTFRIGWRHRIFFFGWRYHRHCNGTSSAFYCSKISSGNPNLN